MFKVLIKGLKQFYLTLDEHIPEWIEDEITRWNLEDYIPLEVKEYIRMSNEVRLLIARGVPDWKQAYIYMLYWYHPYDLVTLDKAISNNIIPSVAFDSTIVTEYQKTRCYTGCGTWWHTLVVPRGTAFAAQPPTLNTEKLGKEIAILDCPECRSSFRQSVVKIIGKADPK